jgi:hypothetical protein
VVKAKRSQSEVKYIAGVFFRTSLVTAAWFGLTGLALNALSDRVSLQCERGEDSLPECQLSVKQLFNETPLNLLSGEFKKLNVRAISNDYFPSFIQWQMAIATSQGQIEFNSYGVTKVNSWEGFVDRTNRFLNTPELRTFTITSEYNFWFKLLSQATSGVSILCGLFIIPSLYLTAKYGSDTVAHQAAIDRVFGQFTTAKSTEVSSQE